MIGRVLLAALLVGIAAGLVVGVLQHVRLVPIIHAAEVFEAAGNVHTHDPQQVEPHAHSHDAATWQPADGFERTAFTLLTTALAGAGFAALLTGLSFLFAVPITKENGLYWGLCGFVAISLAPAAGLPPTLPGLPEADVTHRILWWFMTVVMTAAALWFAAIWRVWWGLAIALVLILLPHMIGAPQPIATASAVPAELVKSFVGNSLALNGLLWILIGCGLGFALDKYKGELKP
jgi:cobalt transporter subunit CbtA